MMAVLSLKRLSICTYMAIAIHLISSASLTRYTGGGRSGEDAFCDSA